MSQVPWGTYLSQPLPGDPAWDSPQPPEGHYICYPCGTGTIYLPSSTDLVCGPRGYWYQDSIYGNYAYMPVSDDRWGEVHPTPPANAPAPTVDIGCDCACHSTGLAQIHCPWICVCRAALEDCNSSAVPHNTPGSSLPVPNPWYARDAVPVSLRTPPVSEQFTPYMGVNGLGDMWQRPMNSLGQWRAAHYAWELQQAQNQLGNQKEHRTATETALFNSRMMLDRLIPSQRSLVQGTEPVTEEQKAIIRGTAQSVRQALEEGFTATLATAGLGAPPPQPTPQQDTRFTAAERAVINSPSSTVIHVYGGPPSGWNPRSNFANLSPSSRHEVVYNNKTYETATHLWHALRFEEIGERYMERIRTSTNPKETAEECWRHLRSFGYQENPGSSAAKLGVALVLKYQQHPDLKDQLLETGQHALSDPADPQDLIGYVLEITRRDMYTETYGPVP